MTDAAYTQQGCSFLCFDGSQSVKTVRFAPARNPKYSVFKTPTSCLNFTPSTPSASLFCVFYMLTWDYILPRLDALSRYISVRMNVPDCVLDMLNSYPEESVLKSAWRKEPF